jgi:hypothetical protein
MKPESRAPPAGEPETRRGRRLWSVIAALPYVIPVALLLCLVIAIILVAIGGYIYKWGWTGFADKTLWDWMKLLIVPIILALGGLLFTQMERLNSARAQALDRERLEVDREQTQIQLSLTRESLEADRQQTQAQLRLTEQGQITQRFTQAIEQLGATGDTGAKKLEIRLGGIYALERIARDSPERDYSSVTEVLTAYVRENTPEAPGPRRPPADIQAILDVLSRAQFRVPEEYRTRLDLHEANLQGANLQGANLLGANLLGASVRGAKGITNEELEQQAASLAGATMPNGQRHQD